MKEIRCRPSVVAFAEAMEGKLVANEHKGGWWNDTPIALIARLREEVDELERSLTGHTANEVLKEAADVGNFAMMIADLVGGLKYHGAVQTSVEARTLVTIERIEVQSDDPDKFVRDLLEILDDVVGAVVTQKRAHYIMKERLITEKTLFYPCGSCRAQTRHVGMMIAGETIMGRTMRIFPCCRSCKRKLGQ